MSPSRTGGTKDALVAALQARSEVAERPDGERYRSLAVAAVRRLAREFGVPGSRVESIALQHGIVPARYSRNLMSFSGADQARLLESTVTVVGAGGLGGWLAEMLARVGVGTLRLVDGDRFDESNLNRQVFSDEDVLSRGKVEVAAERLARTNSSVTVECRPVMLTAQNGEELIAGSDVVADCLDSIAARFILQDAAMAVGAPLVSAAVAGRSGQLLAILPGDAGFRAVFGEPGEVPDRGEETVLGNLAFTVALMSSLQCAEIVRLLLGEPGLYRDRLLLVDLEDGTFEHVAMTFRS